MLNHHQKAYCCLIQIGKKITLSLQLHGDLFSDLLVNISKILNKHLLDEYSFNFWLDTFVIFCVVLLCFLFQ